MFILDTISDIVPYGKPEQERFGTDDKRFFDVAMVIREILVPVAYKECV
mgnify:CR=1 FL=1